MDLDLKAIAVKAVYEAMSEDDKSQLVQKVLDNMLKEPQSSGSSFHKGPSLLEETLVKVLKDEVTEQTREYFKTHQEQLQTLFAAVIGKLLEDDELRNGFVKVISDQMLRFMRGY
jgi:hypothetical protein